MKSINIFILFFLFFSTALFAQNEIIDSLKNELSIHPEEDSTRVNTLNKLAFAYFRTDLAKTVECLDRSKAIAERVGYQKGKAKSIYIRGMAEAVKTKYEKGIAYFEEALQLYQEINFKRGIEKCYGSMGVYFFKGGEAKQAIKYYLKSVALKEELGIKKGMTSSLRYIGLAHSELGHYKEAIGYFKKALKISEEEKNEKDIAESYTNIGNIYSSQGNYPLSLEYHNKSLFIAEKREDVLGKTKALNNIGIIYKHLKDYDKAIVYYEKALPLAKEVGYKRTIGSVLNNLGNLHQKKRNFKVANEYLQGALKINEELNNKTNMAVNLNNIGGLHLELNENVLAHQYFVKSEKINLEIENQRGLCNTYLGMARAYSNQEIYDKALSNLLKSKAISAKLGILNYQRDIAELLAETYEHTGQYQKAFSSHLQFKVFNDSLFNKENIEKITQLEYEYKYKQQLDSASIRELKLTQAVDMTTQRLEKTKRNLLLGVIGFLLMSLVLGAIIFFLKLRNAKSKAQNIAMEQKLLRSQMTPHFVFNSLSVLQGMILNEEDEKSISYLSRFSKLLRITLENSRDKAVPLDQELTAIENYLELQNLEVDQSFQYTISVAENIDTASFEIPPMLIQPFIENAIEHAFKDQKENRKIEVQLKYSKEELICTVTDNGIGIATQKEKEKPTKKSLATTITSERLEMLSKDFKKKGSVTIEDRKKYNQQGTIVTLIIPYQIPVK